MSIPYLPTASGWEASGHPFLVFPVQSEKVRFNDSKFSKIQVSSNHKISLQTAEQGRIALNQRVTFVYSRLKPNISGAKLI